MKRRTARLLLAGLLLIVIAFTGVVGIARAHNFQGGDTITLPAGREIRETVFAAGSTIDIGSEVFGDVFCAGQTVTITGTIHGDILCAAQTINISGKVEGDVRLAAQVVTLDGEVDDNATIASQSFTLGSKGAIGDDLTAGTSSATLNGRIGRDAAVGSATTVIASGVGRDVKAAGETLKLTSGAQIGGSVEFTSDNEVEQAAGANVSGEVTRRDPPKQEGGKAAASSAAVLAAWLVYAFLAMLLIAMAIALLFPRPLHSVTNRAMPRPWMTLLTGFIAHAVAPIVFLLVAATVIGIPLALLAGLAWLLMLCLTGPVVAFYIGRLIFRSRRNALLMMLVGSLILLVLYFIPVVNILAILAVMWLGTGMMLMELYRRWPRPVYEPKAVT